MLVFVARARSPSSRRSTPFGYRPREQLFLAWAGLRGAVPIVLATFALSASVGGSATIFNAVFFVVLVSTLAQGMTLEPFARRLGLATEARPFYSPPVEIEADPRARRRHARVRGRPRRRDRRLASSATSAFRASAIVMLIVREESGIPPRGSTSIEAGDRLYILVRGEARTAVQAAIRRWGEG